MRATKKEEEAMLECYRRLYKASTPSADFDKLVEEAPVNKLGEKVIDFLSYEIDLETHDKILEDIIKEYRITKPRAGAFRCTIILGCSPKYKRD